MGRSPKLTLINKKHFTKEERRIRERNENNLIFNSRRDKIVPPTWLCKRAKDLFVELSDELIDMKIISNLDVNILSLYCDYYIKLIDIEKQIKKESQLIEYTNKSGVTNLVENPKNKIKNKYFEIVNKLSKELFLTPSARTNFTINKAENKESELENFYGDFFNGQE